MNGATEQAGGHWPDIARRWALVGPPLRPCAEDIKIYGDAIARWNGNSRIARRLILGVTPELCHMHWPARTQLLAVDHTLGMINAVWPGVRGTAVSGDWTSLPLDSSSRDLILCDGGFHLLPYPIGQEKLIVTLRRVLAPGGLCIFRLFVPPVDRESSVAVLDDLLAARISNVNILKLRLAMSLQSEPQQGVQLAHVWNALCRVAPDLPALATRINWPIEPLQAIDTYRDCPVQYHFLSVAEATLMFCDKPGGFEVIAIQLPAYELGERCPIVVFRRID